MLEPLTLHGEPDGPGLVPHLKLWVSSSANLGICLASTAVRLQCQGERDGLGLLQGRIERLPDQLVVADSPHGLGSTVLATELSMLPLEEPAPWVYFVHFVAAPSDPRTTA